MSTEADELRELIGFACRILQSAIKRIEFNNHTCFIISKNAFPEYKLHYFGGYDKTVRFAFISSEVPEYLVNCWLMHEIICQNPSKKIACAQLFNQEILAMRMELPDDLFANYVTCRKEMLRSLVAQFPDHPEFKSFNEALILFENA